MKTTVEPLPFSLDSDLYPFERHYIDTDEGRMHYIDEGKGEIILFIHGTPTWSFLYREQIKALSQKYRCIAPDHTGFGLSDKPKNLKGTPQQHATNLEQFINKMGLEKFTLVVHDFGGPIGLSYAIKHPEKVKKIVMFNTWLWETKSVKEVQKIDKLLNSWIGKMLYLNFNISPKMLLKKGFYNRSKLTKSIHRHYTGVFPDKASRNGLLRIGQSLAGSSDWYQEQWEQVSRIKDKPFLILWGMKDKFIVPAYLQKWQQALSNAKVVKYECGHFVQEEKADEATKEMMWFIERGF